MTSKSKRQKEAERKKQFFRMKFLLEEGFV